MPGLEEGDKPYKLCIHYRDWEIGEWICNNVAKSVKDSRRTVIFLSRKFFQSIWGIMEFKTAHKQMMKDKCIRLIIILYDDIDSTKNIDSELKQYLKTNTYISWDDPNFWNRFFYALPHTAEEIDK